MSEQVYEALDRTLEPGTLSCNCGMGIVGHRGTSTGFALARRPGAVLVTPTGARIKNAPERTGRRASVTLAEAQEWAPASADPQVTAQLADQRAVFPRLKRHVKADSKTPV